MTQQFFIEARAQTAELIAKLRQTQSYQQYEPIMFALNRMTLDWITDPGAAEEYRWLVILCGRVYRAIFSKFASLDLTPLEVIESEIILEWIQKRMFVLTDHARREQVRASV